jgi:AcrR family transcriptional regulator
MASVPRERLTPERRRQLTRDALVEAAAEVFARRGFEGASLDEIAETAGFTRGAIYKHFDGKEDLFFAVNEHVNEVDLAGFAELLDENDPMGSETIAAVAKRWRDAHERSGIYTLFLEFNLYALRNPQVRERVMAHRRATSRMIAEFIRERSDAAGIELQIPPEDLARIFLITSDGFTEAALLDPETEGLYELLLEMLVSAIVPPGAQPTSSDSS